MLSILHENLKLCKFIIKLTPILSAAVPVLKIEADTSIDFEGTKSSKDKYIIKADIIVDLVEDVNLIGTAFRTTNYIKICIDNYPTFFKNIIFMKYILGAHDLSNTYKGGLNAYGLCLLYIAFLE